MPPASNTDRLNPSRAAIYARVSTAEQTDGTSLDTQIRRCRDHATSQGWQIVAQYREEGVSGATRDRAELARLNQAIADGHIDIVVVTKLDRPSRSLNHMLDLVAEWETHSVVLVALDDPIDTSTATGRAAFQMRGVFAQLERDLIAERMREGTVARAEQGGWAGGGAPYGYRIVPDPKGRGSVLAVDDQEAAAVKAIYRLLVDEGLTTGQAADKLNQSGYRPRKRDQFTARIVRRMITTVAEHWAGAYQATFRDKRGNIIQETPIGIPAILTVEQHEKLEAVAATTARDTITVHRRYPLRQRLFSEHGTIMWGVPGRTAKRWYACSHNLWHVGRNADDTRKRCGCRRAPAAEVEHAVWDYVVSQLTNPDTLQGLAAHHIQQKTGQSAFKRLDEIADEVHQLEDQIADEYADMIQEGFQPRTARAAIRRFNDQLQALKQEQATLERHRVTTLAAAHTSEQISELSKAEHRLADADDLTRMRVYTLLDLTVHIQHWQPCEHCESAGYLPLYGDMAKRYGFPSISCPYCNRQGHTPVVSIHGDVAPFLHHTLTTEPSRTDITVPFEADQILIGS